jgi:hypothetical protein
MTDFYSTRTTQSWNLPEAAVVPLDDDDDDDNDEQP